MYRNEKSISDKSMGGEHSLLLLLYEYTYNWHRICCHQLMFKLSGAVIWKLIDSVKGLKYQSQPRMFCIRILIFCVLTHIHIHLHIVYTPPSQTQAESNILYRICCLSFSFFVSFTCLKISLFYVNGMS